MSLFRSEVTEQNSHDWLGSVQVATPVSQRMWTIAALTIAAAIVGWLIFGSYTRREHVSGLLVPQAGLIAVTSSSVGIVRSVLVAEGERVNADEPLITLSGEHTSETLGDTGTNISVQLRSQQSELQTDIADTQKLAIQQGADVRNQLRKLNGQLRKIEDQIDIQEQQVQMEQGLLDKITPLLAKGYILLFQVQQERSNLLSAETQAKALQQQHFSIEQQVVSLHDQLDQLPLATAVKLDDLRRQSAQIEQTLEQNEAGRASVVRAPKEGIVSSLLVRPGQAIGMGQSMLAIVPVDSPLEAQLLVPSKSVGFVHPGTQVIMHYQPFPYQKFGLQPGIVRKVSNSALSPSEVATLLGAQPQVTEPQYRVLVNLAAQHIEVYGHDELLKPGMAVDGDLLLDRRHIVEWIFEPLYAAGRRFAKSK
jgi:membrane fusion protein